MSEEKIHLEVLIDGELIFEITPGQEEFRKCLDNLLKKLT